jgi:hypothetical protein
VKLGESFVHFVDQCLGLAEWDEGYRPSGLVTPGVIAR